MIYLKALAFVYIAFTLFSPTWIYNYFTPSTSVHKFGTLQNYEKESIISLKRTAHLWVQTVK